MKILSGLSEGQVLQRRARNGASAVVTGICESEGKVLATITKSSKPLPRWKRRVVGESKRGKFHIDLKAIPAGGPYRLRLEVGTETLTLRTFFVGDVWILAGQSNMEGYGNRDGASPTHPLVRAFTMRRVWRKAEDPLHVMGESPDYCHHLGTQLSEEAGEEIRRTTRRGVGPGVFFGREMVRRSRVPQGLICTAHGGTSMAQWNPDNTNPADLMYRSMLESARATGQPVAGILWYQGESDTWAKDVPLYTERMKSLVARTRRDLRQPALPWIMVQIGRVHRVEEPESWSSIQEQQRLLPSQIKNLEVVAAIDLALDDQVHVSSTAHPRLAMRLARVADRLVHRNKKELRPPQLRAIHPARRPESDTISGIPYVEVVFDHVVGGLKSAGEPYGFTLLEPDGKIWPLIFKTTLHGDRVRLHMPQFPPEGSRLSYGHGLHPICTITDGRDMALPVFAPRAIGS